MHNVIKMNSFVYNNELQQLIYILENGTKTVNALND